LSRSKARCKFGFAISDSLDWFNVCVH
jgi:hypothetical protein